MTDEKREDEPDEVEAAAADAEALTHDDEPASDDEPPSSRLNRLVLAAAGVLVAAAVVVLVLVLFVFGNPSPSEVVDDYFQAVKDGDIAEANEHLCAGSTSGIADSDEARAELAALVEDLEWKVTGETVTGDTATVDVEMTGFGESGTDTYTLVKENGDWKICDPAEPTG